MIAGIAMFVAMLLLFGIVAWRDRRTGQGAKKIEDGDAVFDPCCR
jgi:hypothetical protein